MNTIQGYGYYHTTRFRFVQKFKVKGGTLYFLTASLWSFKVKGGHWFLHSITHALRIIFTPVAAGLDTARIIITKTLMLTYKAVLFLINWFFDLLKSLINQLFQTISNKFIGTLLFIAALFLAYLFFVDSTLWRDAKELILNQIT